MKIPSIHWYDEHSGREPEKRAGLIVNGDEDYKDFFKIAEE